MGGRPRPLMLRACILHVLIQYVHEISLNEIKRSLSFYKMQNYIQRPTCRTFFSKSVLNYRCHSYAHSFSPHDQTVDLVCHCKQIPDCTVEAPANVLTQAQCLISRGDGSKQFSRCQPSAPLKQRNPMFVLQFF